MSRDCEAGEADAGLDDVVAAHAEDLDELGAADVEDELVEVGSLDEDVSGLADDEDLVALEVVAFDLEDVVAFAAVDGDVAVVVAPDHEIVPIGAEDDVVATSADDGVVAGAASEGVGGVAVGDDHVVVGAAVEVEGGEGGEADGGDDDVAAAPGH